MRTLLGRPLSLVLPFLVFGAICTFAGSEYQSRSAPGETVREVRIQVLAESNAAVRAARITISTAGEPDLTAITDSSGSATFRGVDVGGHTFTVRLNGKEVYRDQFEIRRLEKTTSAIVRIVAPLSNRNVGQETISSNELHAPAKARSKYTSAVGLIRIGDLQGALLQLDGAIGIYPEYARAHNARGVVLNMLNRVKESEASYRLAIAFDDELIEPHFNLGKLLLDSGRPSEARQELQRAVNLKRTHIPAIELLIDAMIGIHDESSAVSLVKSLHSRGEEHPAHFHLRLATELERHGLFDLAVEQYMLVFEDMPSDSERLDAERDLSRIKAKV